MEWRYLIDQGESFGLEPVPALARSPISATPSIRSAAAKPSISTQRYPKSSSTIHTLDRVDHFRTDHHIRRHIVRHLDHFD